MSRSELLLALLAASVAGAAPQVQAGPAGGPHIDSLSESTLPRSGRLRVFGSAFGAGTGGDHVSIGATAGIVTSWSDTEIHVYVPESTPLGSVDVEVVTSSGSSNALPLTVGLRPSSGRFAWRFELDSELPTRHRPAVGPDGTIYLDEGWGLVYAVSPGGGLEWVYDTGSVAANGPIAVGADGTVYVASGPFATIHALHSDGTLKWIFTSPPTQGVIAGPGVGPEGFVYAVTDNAPGDGIGAFSLDLDGNLRWSNDGDPPIVERGQLGQEIVFGADAMYVAFDEYPVASGKLFGFSLDGAQNFSIGFACDPAQPAIGPDGTVYARMGGLVGGIGAYDSSGNEHWFVQGPAPNNDLLNPVVGPDGTIYTAHNLRFFWALAPDGSTKWFDGDPAHGIMNHFGVLPDNSAILDGGRATYGVPGWVRAYSTQDGSLLWQEDLPGDLGGLPLVGDPVVRSRPGFRSDGQHAYLSVGVLGGDPFDRRGFLYAVAVAGEAPGPGQALCFGDGSSGTAACPCGNTGGPGAGCANSSGAGTRLWSFGSTSVGTDDLGFTASQMIAGQPGLLFAGTGAVGGGSGLPFGDGLRCAGDQVVRLGVETPAPDGSASWGPGLAQRGGWQAGDTRFFQAWYRDSAGPCASGFNLSQGLGVTFTP